MGSQDLPMFVGVTGVNYLISYRQFVNLEPKICHSYIHLRKLSEQEIKHHQKTELRHQTETAAETSGETTAEITAETSAEKAWARVRQLC